MDYKEKIFNLLRVNNGIITGKQVEQEKIPRTYIKILIDQGRILRIERGVYSSLEAWEDEMYILQYKHKRGIFSHITALYIHQMTDKTPEKFDMTFPFGYNAKYDKSVIKARRCIENIYSIGIESGKTPFGRTINVYDIERTICDILKSNCYIQIVNDAIKRYLLSNGRNVTKLIKYGVKLKVENKLNNYLRILL